MIMYTIRSLLLFITLYLGYTVQVTYPTYIVGKDHVACSSLNGPYCYPLNKRRIPYHYRELLRSSSSSQTTSTSPTQPTVIIQLPEDGKISSNVLAQIGNILEKLKSGKLVPEADQHLLGDETNPTKNNQNNHIDSLASSSSSMKNDVPTTKKGTSLPVSATNNKKTEAKRTSTHAKRTHTLPGTRSSSRTTGRSQRNTVIDETETTNTPTNDDKSIHGNPTNNNNYYNNNKENQRIHIDTKNTENSHGNDKDDPSLSSLSSSIPIPPSSSSMTDSSLSSSSSSVTVVDTTTLNDFVEDEHYYHSNSQTMDTTLKPSTRTPLEVHIQIDTGSHTEEVTNDKGLSVSTESTTTMFEFDLDEDTLVHIFFHSRISVQSIEKSLLMDILRQTLTEAITQAPDSVRNRFLNKPNFGKFIQQVVENMVDNIRRYN